MARRHAGGRLALATHNRGKLVEIAALVAPFGIETVAAEALGVPEPEETGATFEENAALKALAVARASGLPALSDDSGLVVPALDGAPGIYSARWAGPGRDFAVAMKKVEDRLEEARASDFSAWFTSALAVAWPGGPAVVVEGRVDGTLSFPPRGDKGFGYDPIFTPQGGDQTFGEMERGAKDGMSHRARAFAKLKAALL
jgi:XTP/dITP diphosphohydrolase